MSEHVEEQAPDREQVAFNEHSRAIFDEFRDALRSGGTVRIELVPGISLSRGGGVQRAYISTRPAGADRFKKIRMPLMPGEDTGDEVQDRAALLADLRRVLLDDPEIA